MNNKQLTELIETTLEDNKAFDIKTLDVKHLTDVTETIIICTATSSRHAHSLSQKVIDAAREQGVRPLCREGQTEGRLEVAVHIMMVSVTSVRCLTSNVLISKALLSSSVVSISSVSCLLFMALHRLVGSKNR